MFVCVLCFVLLYGLVACLFLFFVYVLDCDCVCRLFLSRCNVFVCFVYDVLYDVVWFVCCLCVFCVGVSVVCTMCLFCA